MEFAIFAFCIIFVLMASGGVLIFYREAMLRRLHEVINPRPKQKVLSSSIEKTRSSLGGAVQQLQGLLPKSDAEVSIVKRRLIRAGFRDESAVKFFYGSKVLGPLLLCALALVTGVGNWSPFAVYILSAAFGYLAPDFWLGRRIAKRQKRMLRGLPDVLDLLVICIEAGLGMDQATARTAAELSKAQPELCDEFGIVVLEQRAGRARSECWRNLADRSDLDSLRNLVSMMVQSEQFGTSIAKTLRVHADALRTQRVQAVEELAAKTSTKLVFPLVFFIFPALFLVTLGPAMILMMESFKSMPNH